MEGYFTEEISLRDHIVKVDREKTIELYQKLPGIAESSHCGCMDCRLYVKQIGQASAKVLAFFHQFGIDPTKEAEVWRAISNENGFDTYTADYHFVGNIQGVDELEWIQIEEASFGLVNYTRELPSPMIPSAFSKPIVEMAVRITMPHSIKGAKF
ncbi:hypothetical protein MHZ95_15790 [Sporosarcina sp. ACRSM]|uniref:hypothetical protein n=1 Tax=Sporosarcina sp. ACRSM TaxID=2918216 RepID=UPI001EF4E35E|nr:hypothetical protein [Sporosarcina sp. ACRSM]MCG7336729.1 hypothetical protein [Sporosarcina sp. ACRSM]